MNGIPTAHYPQPVFREGRDYSQRSRIVINTVKDSVTGLDIQVPSEEYYRVYHPSNKVRLVHPPAKAKPGSNGGRTLRLKGEKGKYRGTTKIARS